MFEQRTEKSISVATRAVEIIAKTNRKKASIKFELYDCPERKPQ